MTYKETVAFNKRCAKLIGGIYSKHAKAWGFGNAQVVPMVLSKYGKPQNVVKAQRFEKELRFNSDWNWIMEALEAIGNLKAPKEYINISPYWLEISPNRCKLRIHPQFFLIHFKTREIPFDIIEADSTKEAVVKGINKFLNWYDKDCKK